MLPIEAISDEMDLAALETQRRERIEIFNRVQYEIQQLSLLIDAKRTRDE